MISIKPLWGFLIYDIYAMTLRLADIEVDHYWMEFACLALTIVLVLQAVAQSESGKPKEEADQIGFRKVLAAHSFSWVGVHTMFVYMLFYIQDKYALLDSIQQGRVVSWSFLILNGVAAILPVALLEATHKDDGSSQNPLPMYGHHVPGVCRFDPHWTLRHMGRLLDDGSVRRGLGGHHLPAVCDYVAKGGEIQNGTVYGLV